MEDPNKEAIEFDNALKEFLVALGKFTDTKIEMGLKVIKELEELKERSDKFKEYASTKKGQRQWIK